MNNEQFNSLKERALIFRKDSAKQRSERLKPLLLWIEKHEDEIVSALQQDFAKPKFETIISEVIPTLSELRYAIKNVKKWMRDTRVSTPLSLVGHQSYIRHENKGVVLIISPWNYPFQLAVVPLIAALAAGNTVVIKPSELTPKTSELLKSMVEKCFYQNEVLVELGGKEKTEELLKFNFNHVFFTGSIPVGKIISQTCASRLIPLTLELGGKSPTIVDESADLNDAAEKIFWAKFLNRAQTCVAPDYLLVHSKIADSLMEKIKALSELHDKTDKAKIISPRHHQRLIEMLGNKNLDLNSKSLALVELQDVGHPVMQDEIFGPILPYFKFDNLSDIKKIISADDRPLALYVFSKNQNFIDSILNNFQSGGVGINAVLVQFGNHHLPFGGVGESGYGAYHGYRGFSEMSHARGVIRQRFFSFSRKILAPPYSDWKFKIISLFKKL